MNRVSLGVQSMIDREAQVSGRLHNRATVMEDLRRLRGAGIANLSVDLIAGLAGQTFESWEESLAALVESGVPHASVYMLEVDEDSRLGREMLSGGARYHAGLVPSDDAIAQMYSWAIERLEMRGWSNTRFPISAGRVSNRGTICATGSGGRIWGWGWMLRRCCGRRCMKESRGSARYVLRSTTTDDLAAFLEGPEAVETAWLGPARQLEEAWFLGLRLNAGVEVSSLENEFGAEMVAAGMEAVERLVEDGLLTWDGETARLTARGRLISNNVFQEFLGSGLEEGGADERIRAIAG